MTLTSHLIAAKLGVGRRKERAMDLGIVSNCWRTQLEAGTALDDLIAEAARRRFVHIELRQGCLGAYENADAGHCPDAGALQALPTRFPSRPFNLALAMPFLGGTMTPEHPLFAAGLHAAVALGAAGKAHLRLVDPETPPEALTEARQAEVAEGLVALAEAAAAAGAILSVENSRQPWAALCAILVRARTRLGAEAGSLGLCYDPCNLLNAADRPDPRAETGRLRAEEIALFHYKQSRNGAAAPDVGPGDIDWPAQRDALRRIGYDGPRLFEIPAGLDIWDRLERSRDYLEELETQE
jgi:sugar phosphate isomerase/epimerase